MVQHLKAEKLQDLAGNLSVGISGKAWKRERLSLLVALTILPLTMFATYRATLLETSLNPSNIRDEVARDIARDTLINTLEMLRVGLKRVAYDIQSDFLFNEPSVSQLADVLGIYWEDFLVDLSQVRVFYGEDLTEAELDTVQDTVRDSMNRIMLSLRGTRDPEQSLEVLRRDTLKQIGELLDQIDQYIEQ